MCYAVHMTMVAQVPGRPNWDYYMWCQNEIDYVLELSTLDISYNPHAGPCVL